MRFRIGRAVKTITVLTVALAFLLVPTAAFAQESYGGGQVSPTTVVVNPGGSPVAAQETTSGSLPVTGGDLLGLVLISAAIVAVGTLLVLSARRRADVG